MKTPILFLTTCALALAFPGVARAGHHGGGHSGSHHGADHHYAHHSHGSIHYGHGYGLYGGSLYGLSRYGYYRSQGYYRAGPTYYRGRLVADAPDGALAAEVQAALARRGYYRGPIDGIIGTGKRRALRAYQHDRDLPVSARIDRNTLYALGLS